MCAGSSCETASFVHALTLKKGDVPRSATDVARPRQSSPLPALGRHPRVHVGKVFRSVVVGPSASVQHRNGSILGARVAGFPVRVKCGTDVHSHMVGFLCGDFVDDFRRFFASKRGLDCFKFVTANRVVWSFWECEDLHRVQFRPKVHVRLRVRGILFGSSRSFPGCDCQQGQGASTLGPTFFLSGHRS